MLKSTLHDLKQMDYFMQLLLVNYSIFVRFHFFTIHILHWLFWVVVVRRRAAIKLSITSDPLVPNLLVLHRVYYLFFICDALSDLVPFGQFKKREKHRCRSVNFSKVADFSQILLKLTLLHGCFSRFLNCTNGTKSHNASQNIFHWTFKY